jgi:hypothetical protein
MATITVGTAATTSLVGVVWSQDPAVLLPADLMVIRRRIKDDLAIDHPVAQDSGIGGIERSAGKLWVPNRGSLVIYPGDVIATDARGGVVLISAYAAAGANWVVSA